MRFIVLATVVLATSAMWMPAHGQGHLTGHVVVAPPANEANSVGIFLPPMPVESVAPYGAPPTEASGQLTGSQPSQSNTDAAAEQETEIAAQLEELGKRITVVTATTDVRVVIGGAVVADFLYNEARPLAPGTPFFLTPGSPFGL